MVKVEKKTPPKLLWRFFCLATTPKLEDEDGHRPPVSPPVCSEFLEALLGTGTNVATWKDHGDSLQKGTDLVTSCDYGRSMELNDENILPYKPKISSYKGYFHQNDEHFKEDFP